MRFILILGNVFRKSVRLRIAGYVACSLVMILLVMASDDRRKPVIQEKADAMADGTNATTITDSLNSSVDGVADPAFVDASGDKNELLSCRVTLEFAGDDINLGYHLGKVGKAWSKGENVRPGYLSYWTGWTYPALRELGEGEHTIPYLKDKLTQEQRLTLMIEPNVKYARQ